MTATRQRSVFVWDGSTDTTIRITNGNSLSAGPAISADGRHITHWSWASDLVRHDLNGHTFDVFVWARSSH